MDLLDQNAQDDHLPAASVPPAPPPPTDLALILSELRAMPSLTPEVIDKILNLRARARRDEAEVAFNAAYPDLQAALPTVPERGRSSTGPYALLEDIIECTKPVLKAHGFGLTHRTEFLENGRLVRVVGTLTHKAGHSISSEFVSPADTSGSKNAVQAIGSIITYGRRYTTNSLLLIATRGEDTDARTTIAPAQPLSRPAPTGYDEWLEHLQMVADNGLEALEAMWAESPPALKTYIRTYELEVWARIKTKAANVSTAAKKRPQ